MLPDPPTPSCTPARPSAPAWALSSLLSFHPSPLTHDTVFAEGAARRDLGPQMPADAHIQPLTAPCPQPDPREGRGWPSGLLRPPLPLPQPRAPHTSCVPPAGEACAPVSPAWIDGPPGFLPRCHPGVAVRPPRTASGRQAAVRAAQNRPRCPRSASRAGVLRAPKGDASAL